MMKTHQSKIASTEPHQEEALTTLLQAAYQVEDAPFQLRDRVAHMASQAPPVPLHNQQEKTRRCFFALPRTPQARLTLGVCVVAIFLFAMSLTAPRVQGNVFMARVEAALARVQQVHCVRWRIQPNGQRIKEGEFWKQGEMWRVEAGESHTSSIYKGNRHWSYDANTNTVTLRKSTGLFHYAPSGFTLGALVSDMNRSGSKTSTQILGTTTYRGRQVNRVELSGKTDYETTKLMLLVDEETNLPLKGDMRVTTVYGKTGRWELDLTYNQPTPVHLFEPNFNPNQKFVDVAQAQDAWDRRLSKGIARQKIGERTIVLRDLQVNAHGDVFLLYSAGKVKGDNFGHGMNSFGRDWEVRLSDDTGTTYQLQDLMGVTHGISRLVAGERLESNCWIPKTALASGQTWRPRTFTIRFAVNPKNLHGGSRTKFLADHSAQTSFKVHVESSKKTLVPDYAHFFYGRDFNEGWIKQVESETRHELSPSLKPSVKLVRTLVNAKCKSFNFSPDSSLIAIQREIDPTTELWNSKTGQKVRSLPSNGQLTFAPDGKTVVSAITTPEGAPSQLEVQLWDVATGKIRSNWKQPLPHNAQVRRVMFAPNGKTLLFLHSVVTKRRQSSFLGPDLKPLSFPETNDIIAQERDVTDGKLRSERVLTGDTFNNMLAQATPNAATWIVATGGNYHQKQRGTGNCIQLWNGRTGEMLPRPQIPAESYAGGLNLTPKGDRAVLQSTHQQNGLVRVGQSTIYIFDVNTGRVLRSYPIKLNSTGTLALSPDATRLAVPSPGKGATIQVLDTQTGRVLYSLVGHGSLVRDLLFSPDGKTLLSGDVDGRVLQWKID